MQQYDCHCFAVFPSGGGVIVSMCLYVKYVYGSILQEFAKKKKTKGVSGGSQQHLNCRFQELYIEIGSDF